MVRCNFKIFIVSVFLLFLVSFTPSLLADQKVSNQPSKTEVIQKTQKLQIPFIANDGQTNEKVKFYANTFGGTVFVTKEGEIVYALPTSKSGELRDERSKAGRQKLEDRGKKTESNPQSVIGKIQPFNSAICNPQSEIRSVVLKEQFVSAKVKAIQGEGPSVTKVNYFKGKDPSKWKTDISTFETVSLGEVYDGIELKLKAYGNNVEKLFCVKPGADPSQIKVRLSGVNPSKFPLNKGGQRGLSVNEHDELEVETELGPVKFTKPVAYQEIDGKRVEVSVEYCIQKPESGSLRQEVKSQKREARGKRLLSSKEKGMGRRGAYLTSNSQLSTGNLQPEIVNPSPVTRHPFMVSPSLPTTKQKTSL